MDRGDELRRTAYIWAGKTNDSTETPVLLLVQSRFNGSLAHLTQNVRKREFKN